MWRRIQVPFPCSFETLHTPINLNRYWFLSSQSSPGQRLGSCVLFTKYVRRGEENQPHCRKADNAEEGSRTQWPVSVIVLLRKLASSNAPWSPRTPPHVTFIVAKVDDQSAVDFCDNGYKMRRRPGTIT